MPRPALIEVEVVRAIGVPDPAAPGGVRMAAPGEKVKITKEAARKLQETGAIRVVI